MTSFVLISQVLLSIPFFLFSVEALEDQPKTVKIFPDFSDTGRQTSDEDATKLGDWKGIADSFLCSSGTASGVRNALIEYYPDHSNFVLVTSNSKATSAVWHKDYRTGEYHQALDHCGKHMMVWFGHTTVCPTA